jgi:hypothetical protein
MNLPNLTFNSPVGPPNRGIEFSPVLSNLLVFSQRVVFRLWLNVLQSNEKKDVSVFQLLYKYKKIIIVADFS